MKSERRAVHGPGTEEKGNSEKETPSKKFWERSFRSLICMMYLQLGWVSMITTRLLEKPKETWIIVVAIRKFVGSFCQWFQEKRTTSTSSRQYVEKKLEWSFFLVVFWWERLQTHHASCSTISEAREIQRPGPGYRCSGAPTARRVCSNIRHQHTTSRSTLPRCSDIGAELLEGGSAN